MPKWFDDWYKTFDGNKPVALYHLNRTGWGYGLTDDNDCEVDGFADKLKGLFGDLSYEDAQEYLSKAILLGYEVEREPLYYAKIKGWELSDLNIYWNAFVERGSVFPQGKTQVGIYTTKLTKEEWNELGINDTNADFEEVE